MTTKKQQALLVLNEAIGHTERLRSEIPYEEGRIISIQDNLEALKDLLMDIDECKCEA